jgi:[acyl-carrier-protein] S-malonyltransferase
VDVIGFVFPGQGSQRAGMGLDLVRAHPELADAYYGPADDILGFPLSRLCWEGPELALRDTAVTQPAVFLVSLCALHVLRKAGLAPDAVAGHSLGEYTALVCAGVLDWTAALRLVRLRGQLMAEASERAPGTMAAILGMDVAAAEEICARAAAKTGGVVEVANDNAPGQVVISGQADGVERAMAEALDAGARQVRSLKVGAPFHCSLMRETQERFDAALTAAPFRAPERLLISSVTAAQVPTADAARAALRGQITGRVRWTATVSSMAETGVRRFVEVGPGAVLGGLCRRIAPASTVYSTNDSRQCAATADALAASR